jgi:GrpB-like predicted nucleotidyltransferase (UPF0157 family)
MILGLRRGDVRLVRHQPGWSRAFARERDALARRIGGPSVRIEHVGSTAVADLMAKPIIDIAIGVESLDVVAGWPGILGSEGYSFFGDREGRGEHFYAKGPEDRRTLYLHVLPARSRRWADYLRFRDALRASAANRREYEDLKRRLLATHRQDRSAYTESKAAFIRKILGA